MAVTKVSLISAGRTAEGKQDYNRSYAAIFQVLVNDPYDGPGTVLQAVDPNTGRGIAQRWSQYIGYESGYSDVFALCTGAVPRLAESGAEFAKWIVECKFETFFQFQPQQNPSDDPILPWIEIETERRKVTQTWNGIDIKNACGQLVDGIERDFDTTSYCFLRNELSCNPWGFYSNSVNSDGVLGCIPGTLRCKILADKPQRRLGTIFWPTTYKLKYDPKGWNKDIANTGTAVLNEDLTLGTPKDGDGNPLDLPVLLTASGQVLSPNTAIIYLSNAALMGSIPQIYQPLPFAALQLTQSFS